MGSHHIVKSIRPRARKPLALIHFNLCGEICFNFLGGNLFFVTFTNDYSKFTWIYFIRNKYEALQYFQHFKANVELAFNTKIQVF
jgi:hypothetical protein